MISICIPLFNGLEYLYETLISVKNQTFTEFEILIGINGHGKDSGEIFIKVKKIVADLSLDEKCQIFVFEDLKSAPLTINRLVSLSKYEWIAHLDSDDIWKPKKLEKQVEIISKGKVDVIGTHCQYFGEREDIPRLPSGFIDSAFWYYINPLIHSSVIIRKEFAEYSTRFVCYDLDNWLKLFNLNKVFYNVPEILVFHRVYSGSYFNASNDQDPRIVRIKHLKNKYISL
jgi:teichuronic acid biosynthesis glycosyltransferase TuaG